jgi:hypothetical protein
VEVEAVRVGVRVATGVPFLGVRVTTVREEGVRVGKRIMLGSSSPPPQKARTEQPGQLQ